MMIDFRKSGLAPCRLPLLSSILSSIMLSTPRPFFDQNTTLNDVLCLLGLLFILVWTNSKLNLAKHCHDIVILFRFLMTPHKVTPIEVIWKSLWRNLRNCANKLVQGFLMRFTRFIYLLFIIYYGA